MMNFSLGMVGEPLSCWGSDKPRENSNPQRYGGKLAYFSARLINDKPSISCVLDLLSFSAFMLLYRGEEVNNTLLIRYKNATQQFLVSFNVGLHSKINQFLNHNSYQLLPLASPLPAHFEVVTRRVELPQILWLREFQQSCSFMGWVTRSDNYFILIDNNLILSFDSEKQTEIIEELEQLDGLGQQGEVVWKHLGVEIDCNSCDDIFPTKALNLIRELLQFYRMAYRVQDGMKIIYAFQFDSIFDLLTIKNAFLDEGIPFQYISQATYSSMNLFIDRTGAKKQSQISLVEVNQNSGTSDLTHFQSLWNATDENLKKQLDFLSSNWDAFSPFYEKNLQDFQNMVDKKTHYIDSQDIVLPHLKPILRKIEKANEYYGNRNRIVPDATITEILFQHFIYNIERQDRNGIYYIHDEKNGTRIAVEDYIANFQDYRKSEKIDSSWQRIFTKFYNYHHLKELEKANTQILRLENSLLDDYLQEIEWERLPSIDCISCCPFFYAATNISSSSVNSTPLVLLPSISKIHEFEGQLRDEICLLLNSHGGVILFDCVSKNRDIIPVGEMMSLQLKNEIEQKVTSYIQSIYPLPEAVNYSITFVPIVKNPIQQKKKGYKKPSMSGSTYAHTYYEREFIEGVYVTRIKINPTIGERLYFWINDSKPIFPRKVDNKITFTPGRNILKLIKKRFKDYFVPETAENKDELRFLRPKLSYFHAGECPRPDLGVVAVEHKQMNLDLEDAYLNMSVVIARKADLPTIKQRILKRGIDCQIQNKFQQHRFRFLSNSAILYHNMRFDLLLKEVSYQKEFQFGGKFIMLLKITEFIKLIDRSGYNLLSEADFESYQKYYSKEYPNDSIKLWRYSSESQTEFYFQVSSRTKSLFLFCILNQYGEKASFKNPKNFDKLTPSDVNQRFKLFYPRNHEKFQGMYKANLKQSHSYKTREGDRWNGDKGECPQSSLTPNQL